MKVEELVGSLQTFELHFKQTPKSKTIILKILKKTTNEDIESEREDEDEEVALLAQRFKKFFQKNRRCPIKGRQMDNKHFTGKSDKKS
ncbi:hypothetical protein PJI17_31385, partial [Mycobacterium kansasii]